MCLHNAHQAPRCSPACPPPLPSAPSTLVFCASPDNKPITNAAYLNGHVNISIYVDQAFDFKGFHLTSFAWGMRSRFISLLLLYSAPLHYHVCYSLWTPGVPRSWAVPLRGGGGRRLQRGPVHFLRVSPGISAEWTFHPHLRAWHHPQLGSPLPSLWRWGMSGASSLEQLHH